MGDTALPFVRRLRVGSWPGRAGSGNAFIRVFCESLEGAGVDVVDVADPRRLDPAAIDILHIHWPEHVFWRGPRQAIPRALGTLRAISRMRARGVRIVWMVHNLRPHDPNLMVRLLWPAYSAALARMTDAVVTLSPATLKPAIDAFPFHSDVARLAVRHALYPVEPPLRSAQETRESLGLPDAGIKLAFVGRVQPYKGVERLAGVVATLPPADVSLVIAGEVRPPALREELANVAAPHVNVALIARRLDDAEFADLVRAADYVVLPFDKSLHSGSLIHALSLGRPVLTTRTPYAEELAGIIGAQWIRLFDPPLQPAHLAALPPAPDHAADLGALSPQAMGSALRAFFEMLVALR